MLEENERNTNAMVYGSQEENKDGRQSLLETSLINQTQKSIDIPKNKTPLEILKSTIKNQIIRLAKINSKKTVKLVKDSLDDESGDFEEKVVMEYMSEKGFEETQFDYLQAYFENKDNPDEAIETLKESPAQHSKTERNKSVYIEKFVKLICRLERLPNNKLKKGCIEEWVAKSYFPPAECQKICLQEHNLRGQVVLQRRLNKHELAIQACCDILQNKVPINELVQEIDMLIIFDESKPDKDELLFDHIPDFLPEIHFDEAEGKWITAERDPNKKSKNLLNPPAIAEFDEYVQKACDIVTDDKLDQERRRKCWFKVLKFLMGFKKDARKKVDQAISKANNLVCKQEYSLLRTDKNNKTVLEYTRKLEKFVSSRINHILLYERLDIPLKDLMEQLNLSFKQI